MSELEKLEEELYGKDEQKFSKRMERRMVFPGTSAGPGTFWRDREEQKKPASPSRKKFLKMFFAALAVLLIVGSSVFIFFYIGTRSGEASLKIETRGSVESGEIVTVSVTYKNISRVAMRDAELTLVFPAGSKIRETGGEIDAPARFTRAVGDIAPGGEGTAETSVRFFGREGELKKVEAVLVYRPENVSARFSAKTSENFLISRVPLAVILELPSTLTKGQETELKVRYSSNAVNSFENLSLRLEYPAGFSYLSADPLPMEGNTIWNLGTVEPGQDGVINIRGSVNGEEGQIQAFRAEVGTFNRLTKEWKTYSDVARETSIASKPLSVIGFLLDGRSAIVIPGDELNFNLRYKNNTQFSLKNISIRAFLSGSILDLGSLDVGNGGVYDSATQAIIWGPATTPGLGDTPAGKEGGLSIRIKTRASPAPKSKEDKNFTVNLRSVIETKEIPQELVGTKLLSEDKLELKVQSKISFSGKSLYRLSPILNAGPFPPRVDQKTSYVISLEVRNFTNDFGNAEVRGFLPPNVTWENSFMPRDVSIAFDSGSREIRWRIGALPAGTGVVSPALTAAFQVSVRPSVADIKKSITLFSGGMFRADDLFTNEEREEKIAALTTETKEDPGTSFQQWSVAP